MATTHTSEIIRHLRSAGLLPGEAGLSDGQLLEGYVSGRGADAFEALVRRHGPMVWGGCRRVLGHEQDAEDAFQATFLVLARKAGSVRPREMVGNWLYGVAYRTALKARASAARRKGRERQVKELPEPEAVGLGPGRDLQPLLDQELSRLPEKYRVAVILCELEGRSYQEVARRLRVAEGTVASRLARARAMLARRLARHGLGVSGASLAVVVGQDAASASVPASVLSSAMKVASWFAAGRGTTGLVRPEVVALAGRVVKAMLLNKLKCALAVLLGVGLAFGATGLGVGLLRGGTRAAEGRQDGVAAKALAKAEEKPGGAARPDDKVGTGKDEEARPKAGGHRTGRRIQDLLKERLAILRGMERRAKALYEKGAMSRGQLERIRLRVLKAELDVCETAEARVGVHEKIVGRLKEVEGRAARLVSRGAAEPSTLEEARLERLEAEVALEQARATVARPAK